MIKNELYCRCGLGHKGTELPQIIVKNMLKMNPMFLVSKSTWEHFNFNDCFRGNSWTSVVPRLNFTYNNVEESIVVLSTDYPSVYMYPPKVTEAVFEEEMKEEGT